MVYYWLSWLGVVIFTFFSTYPTRTKRLIVIGLLFNIILINIQINLAEFTFTIPYLYCLIAFWLITLLKPMHYFNYYLLLCLILMYTGFRYLLITSPIWLFVNDFILILIVFVLFLLIFVKSNTERVVILVTSCLTGEWLFAYNVRILNWHLVIGDNTLFSSLYIAVWLLIFFHHLRFSYKTI
ncbi:hypothetical protein KQI76_03605 [Amphibacillus sp. MSJ-3]|uniref:YphA family membrane protein n=1 Tax=Amphibacillus sp. MSJ-3 TaxID=2841505 RepID=UPI001C0F02A2|nr:hypothetical protein [Amphibacillus sp. MSJ-3]MBU5594240.1 hypothetical protein [Amphibacillus sp. MSJ-3]